MFLEKFRRRIGEIKQTFLPTRICGNVKNLRFFAFIIQIFRKSPLHLLGFIENFELFSVFYKNVPRLKKRKSDVVFATFLRKFYNPRLVQRARAIVIFAAAPNIFDFLRPQIFFQRDFPDKRRNQTPLVFERKLQQNRNSFVGTLLIFRGDVQPDIFPAVTSVVRQTFWNSLRSFGHEDKDNVAAFSYDFPSLRAPAIGL